MELKNRTKLKVFSAAGAALVLAILAAVNVLSQYAYLRLDRSQGRIYSLSPASKQLLARLEEPVYITAYFSPQLPPQYAAGRDYLANLLAEYAAYSRGKLRFEFFAAADGEKFREAAVKEGVYPIRFNILEKERYEVREAFLGLVIKYLDKKEVMPFVQDTTGLEYDVTGRIQKMMRKAKKAVGIASAYGAMSLEELPRGVRDRLSEAYDVKAVDLVADATGAFKGLDAFLLLGPVQRVEDKGLYAMDQFLLSGGSLGLALDSKRVDMRSFVGSPLDLGLDGWLRHVGLPLRKNLALDRQNQKVSVSAQQGYMTVTNILDYPAFVLASDLNGEHPLSKGLDSLVMPYVAPIEVSTTTGLKVTPLVNSSRMSWMRRDWERQFARVNPFEPATLDAEDPKGPFTLAVAAEGRFNSYWPSALAKTEAPFLKESAKPGRLVLVGTSRFIHPDFPLPENNAVFFMNMVDWLAQDAELIAIRSKTVAYRPLREIAPEAKTAVRYANMLAGPLCIIGLGLLRWRRRATRSAARIALYKA